MSRRVKIHVKDIALSQHHQSKGRDHAISLSRDPGSRDRGIEGSRDHGITGSRDQGIKGSRDKKIQGKETTFPQHHQITKSPNHQITRSPNLLPRVLIYQFFDPVNLGLLINFPECLGCLGEILMIGQKLKLQGIPLLKCPNFVLFL